MALLRALSRSIKHLRERAAGLSRRVDFELPCQGLGSEYGRHAVCLERIRPGAVVYSFGLELDISFDLELIDRTGAMVFGFDPTPRSIAYVKQQALPVGFELREYGVGDHDGVVTFHAPENPEHISHSMVARKGAATHEFPIKRLSTIMREHGHRRLDVLKMDVEGAEYDVLDQLIAQKLDIDQLLIEFHHQLPGIPPARTARALQALRDGGWGVVHVAANLREFSLARR